VQELSLLDPWNEILATEALKIVQAREEFVAALEVRAREVHARFCAEDQLLSLQLKSNISAALREPAALREEYRRVRPREAAARSALLGPHRDDMLIEVGTRDARAFASQGQTRSIVLALTLGVIELLEERKGESPIVLLDDVNSELDSARSDSFFALVLRQNRQIFVTGTDVSVGHLTSGKGYNLLSMQGGQLAARPL
jgi:DNA replication and repair protein RecF